MSHSKPSRSVRNMFVSQRVSQTDKRVAFIKSLKWQRTAASKKLVSKAWEFMGNLVKPDGALHNDGFLYCKYCFDNEVSKENPILSSIYSTAQTTATGNWLCHCQKEHSDAVDAPRPAPAKVRRLDSWFSQSTSKQPAKDQFEFNRDIGLMVCRDLLPFNIVEKRH